jgi:hypothetical protein
MRWAEGRPVKKTSDVYGGTNRTASTAGHRHAALQDLRVRDKWRPYKPRADGHTGQTHNDKSPQGQKRGQKCGELAIQSRKLRDVISSLVAPRYNYGVPRIVVANVNDDGSLWLEHEPTTALMYTASGTQIGK